MGQLVTIDPGTDTGWARFEKKTLFSCGIVHPEGYAELPFVIGLGSLPPDLVVEEPRDYGSNRQVDPNDLLSLQAKLFQVVGVYRAYWHLMGFTLKIKRVYPREWKGQVPKGIHHERELAKLSPDEWETLKGCLEKVPKGQRHDVKDAVCLGLWRLGR